MALVVDPWHWLDEHGELLRDNLPVRRNMIRVARVIEYGARLKRGKTYETLIECHRRPGGIPCLGLLIVTRTDDDYLLATCPDCRTDQMVVSNWQNTKWARVCATPSASRTGFKDS